MNQLEILLKLKNETASGFAQLEKSVDAVRKQTDSMASASKSSAGVLQTLGNVALATGVNLTTIAAAATKVVGTVVDMAREFGKAGSELIDLKKQTDVGVVEMQKMQFAAKQAGVDIGGLTTSLSMMEKVASKSPEKIMQLGISFGQIRASKPDELMRLISDGLQGVHDQNERARIATEIFGRSGSQMLKMLTDDYRGLLREAEKTGLMTEAMAAKGDRLDDAFSKLDTVTKNLRVNLAAAFSDPAVIGLMDKMADLIGLMARNADKLYIALKVMLGPLGMIIQGLESWARLTGGGVASPGEADSTGSSDPTQLQTGKGFDAVTKALQKAMAAMDKLGARVEKEAAKIDKDSEKLADKVTGFLSDIPKTLSAALDEMRKSVLEGAARAGYGPGIEDSLGGTTHVPGQVPMIPLDTPGMAQWIPDAVEEYWKNAPLTLQEIGMLASQAKDKQNAATESARRWAGALQGVALVAGSIGGKIGDTASVMMNIGKSFEGWKDMDKYGKFNAVAGGVGQIGGLVGGTAGSGIQGAAGGAMAGFTMSGGNPLGAVLGGLIGGIGGIFGGKSKAKKELEDLKTQLTGMSDAAKKFGINLDAAMASKNSGVVKAAIDQVNSAIKESEKRLAGLSTAAGGLNSFVSGGGVTDQASFDRAGMYAGAIFAGQLKETGDAIAALRSIGPALEEMQKKAKDLGLNVGGVVENLLGMNNVLNANEGLADQVSGINQLMKGLGEAGMITRDMFAALGADATAVFNRLIEGGATGNQALTLMQPTLQQLYEGQKLHGYAVDEATQALLDQAKAEGIVGDSFMSANERMVELLGILIETIGGTLPDSYKRAGDAAEEYGRRARNSIPPAPPGPGGGYHETPPLDDPGEGFASGTAFRNFGSGTRVTLHGEEAVLRRDQVDRLVSMAVSGAPGSTVPMGGGGVVVNGPIYIQGVQDVETFARQLRAVVAENIGGSRRAIQEATR